MTLVKGNCINEVKLEGYVQDLITTVPERVLFRLKVYHIGKTSTSASALFDFLVDVTFKTRTQMNIRNGDLVLVSGQIRVNSDDAKGNIKVIAHHIGWSTAVMVESKGANNG
jgi:hypothetical protein